LRPSSTAWRPISPPRPTNAAWPDACAGRLLRAVRERYNKVYSDLNDLAAERYWRPFADAKPTLAQLFRSYDLYVCSGVIEQILQRDFDHHGFDRSIFQAVWGATSREAPTRRTWLRKDGQGLPAGAVVGRFHQGSGVRRHAGAKFFACGGQRQLRASCSPALKTGLPDQTQPWGTPRADRAVPVQDAAAAGGLRRRQTQCPWKEISIWIHE